MDDLTKQIEREVCGEYNPAGPSLRIGDQSFPAPGNPFLVETYRALLAAAVRLVESRAKAAPEEAAPVDAPEYPRPPRDEAEKPDAAGGPGQYRCPECSLVVTPVNPDVERHPPTCVHGVAGKPARFVRMVPVLPCPDTCETEIDRLADRVLRGHRDTMTPEVAERVRQRVRERVGGVREWLDPQPRELTEAEIEDCARAARFVMGMDTDGPINSATLDTVRRIVDGRADSPLLGYAAAVLARAAELRKERP